jgi:hypothetical protein
VNFCETKGKEKEAYEIPIHNKSRLLWKQSRVTCDLQLELGIAPGGTQEGVSFCIAIVQPRVNDTEHVANAYDDHDMSTSGEDNWEQSIVTDLAARDLPVFVSDSTCGEVSWVIHDDFRSVMNRNGGDHRCQVGNVDHTYLGTKNRELVLNTNPEHGVMQSHVDIISSRKGEYLLSSS